MRLAGRQDRTRSHVQDKTRTQVRISHDEMISIELMASPVHEKEVPASVSELEGHVGNENVGGLEMHGDTESQECILSRKS